MRAGQIQVLVFIACNIAVTSTFDLYLKYDLWECTIQRHYYY